MQGKYDEAKPLLTRALAIIEDAYGPEHYEVATALNNGAGLLKAQVRGVVVPPVNLFLHACLLKRNVRAVNVQDKFRLSLPNNQ